MTMHQIGIFMEQANVLTPQASDDKSATDTDWKKLHQLNRMNKKRGKKGIF